MLQRVFGQRHAVGNDDGERFADVAYLADGDHRLLVGLELRQQLLPHGDDRNVVANVLGGDDRADTGTTLCRRHVDGADTAVRDRASEDHRVQRIRTRHVINELAATAQETQVFQALDRTADGAVRCGVRCHCYSIFTPAAFTTSAHFTRSARVKAVKASGLSDSSESAPTSSKFFFTAGRFQMRLASTAIFSTIGFGTPAGANNPATRSPHKPLTVSPMPARPAP